MWYALSVWAGLIPAGRRIDPPYARCGTNAPLNIPNILESIALDVSDGKIPLHKAAEKLAEIGWNMGIISDEYAAKTIAEVLRDMKARHFRRDTECE